MTVNVYLQTDTGNHKFECRADLIKKLPMSVPTEPFPIVDECIHCGKTLNITKEKWLVRPIIDTHINIDCFLVRYIHVHHSEGIPHIKDEYDED